MTAKQQRFTLGTLGGILLGFVSIVGGAWALSTKAAAAVVAPVENKVDQHLAAVAEARKVMEAFAERTDKRLAAICKKTHCEAEE